MSAIVPYVSFISQYIPAAVKDAAGLCPQISEAVRHVTWLSVDRVFWPGAEVARFFLVLGYADGFQLWDLQDPGAAREVLSKKGNWGILQAKMLPAPMAPTAPSAAPARQAAHGMIGLQHAPLLAYQRQGVPNVVRLFSLRSNDDVHLLRLIEPARSLQASRRYFAVGFARQAELYDALTFEALFSVQCSEGPSFVLGHRWLAYNLPPQQSAASSAGLAAGRGLLAGGARQLPTVMRDGVRYLGQVGQRTLDNMLMPLPEGADQPPVARAGVVVVRDVASRGVVAQFEDHSEPVDAMAWDPSGLQLVTAGAQGHQVLVHRALLGMQQALVVQDAAGDGPARGGVVFQHLYTLSRGVTPAVISDIAVSDNGQFVAVSSAKGTTHVFRLPPLHSAAIGHHCLAEQGAVRLAPAQPRTSAPAGEVGVSLSMGGGGVAHRPATLHACTRVRLGSVLLQEGLMPKCGFPAPAPPPSSGPSRMFVATRAGTVQLYTLSPGGPSGGAGGAAAAAAAAQGVGEGSFAPPARPHGGGEGGDWQAVLTRETQVWRQLAHFSERRLSPAELSGEFPSRRGPEASSPRASPRGALPPRQMPGAWQAASPRAAAAGHSSARASPTLGPRQSPALSPADRRSPPRPGAGPPAQGSEPGRAAAPGWASEVETATHAPVEVPLWLCPQLSFHTYPAGARPGDLNAALRSGQAVGGRRKLVMSRPPRLGEGYDVQYRGRGVACAGGGQERLSDALGAAVSQAAASPRGGGQPGSALGARSPLGEEPVEELRTAAAEVTMAPAWGAVGYLGVGSVEDAGGNLLQADGVGCGMEEVVEDWLTAP